MTKKILVFCLFFLLCGEAAATIFTVVPTDKSQSYLGAIFGGSIGTIYLGGGVSNPTLGLMFERFNFIVVTIGAIVLSYIGVVSTINTAREGQPMGQKMSLWVPLRAILGMLMMIPTTGAGYSIIQMTILWIVLNGIGAANVIWNVVLNQAQNGSSAVGTAITIPIQDYDVINNGLPQYVLNASTCMASLSSMASQLAQISGNNPFAGGTPLTTNVIIQDPVIAPANSAQPTGIIQTATINVGIANAAPQFQTLCGSFTVQTQLNCSSPPCASGFNTANITQRLNIKVNALLAMFNAVQNAAQSISANQNADQLTKGYIEAAAMAYIDQITGLVNTPPALPPADAASWETGAQPASTNIAQIQSYGWIHAGSYYQTLLMQTPSQSTDPDTTISTIPTNPIPAPLGAPLVNGKPSNPSWSTWLTTQLNATQIATLNNSLIASQQFGANDKIILPPLLPIMGTTNISTGNGIADTVFSVVFYPIRAAASNFINDLTTGTTDPLISMANHGADLMSKAEAAMFGLFVAIVGISLALSSVSCMSPFAWMSNSLLAQLGLFIAGFMILLWTAGATLGIWVPLIPYLVFTMSALGWLIAVTEAIVGAPIIALALIHPSGEELGKVGGALVILANIFLRPTLMIFGFILGASMLRAALNMINFGFGIVTQPPSAGGASMLASPTTFTFVPILMLYSMFVIAVVNKSFSLIYVLPDQILRWIGHSGEKTDVGMMSEAQKGFESGAGKVQEGGKALQDTAGSKTDAFFKKKAEMDAGNKKEVPK